MKTKILISILVGMLVIPFVSSVLAIPANDNAGGPERVPVFIGFRQTPGPSEQALVRAHGGAIKYSYHLVPAIAASIPEPAIEGLRRNPNVTYIEPVIEVYAVSTDPVLIATELADSWGVERIGAGTVHASGNTGAGIKVAIIDSGIDYTHPDLDGNYVDGKDFVNNDDDPMDDNGHGTHVAGIVAAERNGSGVVGVAPGAKLYALKVLGTNGSGSYDDVVAALQWAKDEGIQVTNNSYGSSGEPTTTGSLTVKQAFEAYDSAVHICAAGNDGPEEGTVIYPAKYDSCIAVGATDSSDNIAWFSSTGTEVELAAPGRLIYSTYMCDKYRTYSGTSMAAPHVAGVAALILAADVVVDVRTQLQNTADYLGDSSQYGWGLVNAVAAVGEDNPPVDSLDVSIYAPTEGETLNGIYFVLVSATSDDVVNYVGLSIDDSANYFDITSNFDIETGFYYYDWDTRIYGDGANTLQAQATDDEENIIATDSVEVTVNNSLCITVNDLEQEYAVKTDVTISGIVTDDVNLVNGATVTLEIETPKGLLSYNPDVDDNGYYSEVVTVSNRTGTGWYYVTVTAENDGVHSEPVEIKFEVMK